MHLHKGPVWVLRQKESSGQEDRLQRSRRQRIIYQKAKRKRTRETDSGNIINVTKF